MCRLRRWRTCRLSRLSAAPWATPATTWCVTRRTCRNAPADDRQLPDLSFAFYDRLVVFDHVTKTMLVVVLVRTKGVEDLDDACTDSRSGDWTT